MTLGRREILAAAALGGGGLAAASFVTPRWLSRKTDQPRVREDKPALAIPALLRGNLANGVREYDLTLQKGVSQFLNGRDTPTIGINRAFLGPTLAMYNGETVRMNVTNRLDEAATLHWHGFHLPALADGGPHQPIRPGATWSPQFEVRQRGSLFWYHSHSLHRAGPQVYRGLAGAIIVRDQETERLALPNTYGVDDLPLIVQDRSFDEDGSFAYPSSMMTRMMGATGDTLLVNGGIDPVFEAQSAHVRLRILNASNARFYSFAFSDGRSFYQIGTDGGLLAEPHKTVKIHLAPAERTQIVVDVADGKPAQLLAFPAEQGMMGGGMMGGGTTGATEPFRVVEIRPGIQRMTSAPLPVRLVQLEAPNPSAAVRKRRFVLDMPMGKMMGKGGFTINGRPMDMQRIDETVKMGETEIWEIENASMMAHPFHVHDVQFRILDRNGKPPHSGELGFKDVVVVAPRERVRILLRFDDYADPAHPYMYHCHILEHEDAGMMGQFVVVQ